jgi:putative transposase
VAGATRTEQATKGRFALNTQTVQQIIHVFLANVETTLTSRREHPEMYMKYPWRPKEFYPVKWPAQAVHKEQGRVVLPMGRGRPSLVLTLDLSENSGACTLVWNRGFELTRLGSRFPRRKRHPARCRRPWTWGKFTSPP